MTTPARRGRAAAIAVDLRSPARGGRPRRGWRPDPAVVARDRRPAPRRRRRRTRSRRRRSPRSRRLGRPARSTSADQLAVPAPGPAARQPRGPVPPGPHPDGCGWSPWSDALRIEAGLLQTRRTGSPVRSRCPTTPGAIRQAPAAAAAAVVRRSTRRPPSARLYVTALGLHQVTLNGRPVSDDLLAPGWTAYRHRLLADTYDVTALLRPGRERHRRRDRRRLVSRAARLQARRRPVPPTAPRSRVIAQLEVRLRRRLDDGRSRPTTTWRASTGEIRSADLYDGCVDRPSRASGGLGRAGLRRGGLDAGPSARGRRSRAIEPRLAPPVRVIGVLPATRLERGPGRTLLDGGQNVAGYVRLTVRGSRGTVVTVRHAEVLEPDGSLHLRALRSARATDTWVLADDAVTVLEPAFTFHGFQLRRGRDGRGAPRRGDRGDQQRRPSARRRSSAATRALNRLHENVAWSQRDNFVSVPTDCPQRDERLGWTGDAQAFVATGSTLLDAEAFWRSWLRDLALEQDPVLGVPSVVPDVVLDGPLRFGRAGWADAATIVPWAVYEAYGDPGVIADQWDSMRSLGRVAGRRGEARTACWARPPSSATGWIPTRRRTSRGRPRSIRTSWPTRSSCDSARLTAAAARLLGRRGIGDPLRRVGDGGRGPDVAALARARDHDADRRGGRAPARGRAAATSARASRRPWPGWSARPAAACPPGFLGTPLVLPALSDAGLLRRVLPDAAPPRSRPPGCTRSIRARRPSGSAGTRSCPTARSTRGR